VDSTSKVDNDHSMVIIAGHQLIFLQELVPIGMCWECLTYSNLETTCHIFWNYDNFSV